MSSNYNQEKKEIQMNETNPTPVPETDLVTLTYTEAELTDTLIQELAKQKSPIIKNPRVILRAGEIEVYGSMKLGFFRGEVHLKVDFSIDAEGNPLVKIISADIHGVPLPSGLRNLFSNMIAQGITSNRVSEAAGFRLLEVQVTDGLLTVTGQKR